MDRNRYTIGQKLRAILVAAQYKIHKNRHKAVEGKWPKDSFDPVTKERTWHECNPFVLIRKLEEESGELITELGSSEHNQWSAENALLEAGDVCAVTMMLVDRHEVFQGLRVVPPRIVCLCGSTKFKEQFINANFGETMRGNIVLTVGFFAHTDAHQHTLTVNEKIGLDNLHKRKIDLADEILVINIGGYIGESTQSEILYAVGLGKPIRYLEPDKPLALSHGAD